MPAGTPALTALANLTLGSAQASVTFSSISGSYRDLLLVINGSVSSGSTYTFAQLNGSGSFIYPGVYMSGDGTNKASASFGDNHFHLNGDNELNTTLMTSITHILDYSATDKHKVLLTRSGDASAKTTAIANRWASTSAVTSIVLYCGNFNNWAAGSTFALYGIASA